MKSSKNTGTAPKAERNIGKKGLLDAEQCAMAKRYKGPKEAPMKSATGQSK